MTDREAVDTVVEAFHVNEDVLVRLGGTVDEASDGANLLTLRERKKALDVSRDCICQK